MPVERIIRKLPDRRSLAVDDRPATVQWMLALWAVLVTALVLVLGGFDDPRLLHNGWFRLAGVGVTWGLLAWAAATPGKWMAQRLRVAVAASLALHTILALALVFAHLTFLLTQPKPDIDRQLVVEPTEVPKLVDVEQPTAEEQPVFEKPVPTDRLAAQQQPKSVVAKVATSTPSEPTIEPPELASSQAPQSLAERKSRSALTHRAKSPGKRSRQPNAATLATTLPETVEARNKSPARRQPNPLHRPPSRRPSAHQRPTLFASLRSMPRLLQQRLRGDRTATPRKLLNPSPPHEPASRQQQPPSR